MEINERVAKAEQRLDYHEHRISTHGQEIEATSGYPTLWGRGAGNATVYFDL